MEGENLQKDDCIYRNNNFLSQWIFDDLTFYKIQSSVPDIFTNLLDYQLNNQSNGFIESTIVECFKDLKGVICEKRNFEMGNILEFTWLGKIKN